MITENNELILCNVYSRRIQVDEEEMQKILKDIQIFCNKKFLFVSSITTVTFGTKKDQNYKPLMDLEILLNIQNQQKIELPYGFCKKEKIQIVNALKCCYTGLNENVIQIYNELNKYIERNKIQPITPIYSVNKNPYIQENGRIDLDLYIGINPNIL